MSIRVSLPLRFSDTDAMGHVNNARFLTYLEDARITFLAQLADEGHPLGVHGIILARSECDYVLPIHLSRQPLEVFVWVERIGTKSFTLGYRIEQDGAVAARATTVVVAYDYAAATTRELGDDERAGLTKHLGAPDT